VTLFALSLIFTCIIIIVIIKCFTLELVPCSHDWKCSIIGSEYLPLYLHLYTISGPLAVMFAVDACFSLSCHYSHVYSNHCFTFHIVFNNPQRTPLSIVNMAYNCFRNYTFSRSPHRLSGMRWSQPNISHALFCSHNIITNDGVVGLSRRLQ